MHRAKGTSRSSRVQASQARICRVTAPTAGTRTHIRSSGHRTRSNMPSPSPSGRFSEALNEDLKGLEFEHKPKGAFGIGISMKLQPGAPIPIRHYRERQLETHIRCDTCTLEYAVYGLFGFCPDCATHNSLQILLRNLALVEKQIALAGGLEEADFRQHLIEDSLENCISAFDGFGREASRVFAEGRKGGSETGVIPKPGKRLRKACIALGARLPRSRPIRYLELRPPRVHEAPRNRAPSRRSLISVTSTRRATRRWRWVAVS